MNQLVTEELAMILEGSLDNILWRSYHNAQSAICQVVYNVVEEVMLDLQGATKDMPHCKSHLKESEKCYLSIEIRMLFYIFQSLY